MASGDIAAALEDVKKKIEAAKSKQLENRNEVTLVAVSKTKPSSSIIDAYRHSQRHFGENYVNELVEKAFDKAIVADCPEIKWHFIGHLQSNKINKLLSVENLYMVQTVDSEKLANCLEKSWSKSSRKNRLKVMVQVNTSGEANKSGILPEDAGKLVNYITQCCSHLEFVGLMTIGLYSDEPVEGANSDFQSLSSCRNNVCEELNLNKENVELSMGMSHDFEHAIEMGSTCVRVGSSIFGSRNYAKMGAGDASQ